MEGLPFEWLNRWGIFLSTGLANLSLGAIPFFLLVFLLLLTGRSWSASLRSQVAMTGFLSLALAATLGPWLTALSGTWLKNLPWSSLIQLGQDTSPLPLIQTHTQLNTTLHWMTWLTGIWLLGFLVSFTPFLVGRGLLFYLRAQAKPLVFEEWEALCRKQGLKKAAYLGTAKDCPVPLTWGSFSPRVLLPEVLRPGTWKDLEPVLIHELSHIKRQDNLRQTGIRFICSVFWFHPLVWILWKILRLETEKACDAQVVASGHNNFSYAEQLVILARRFSSPNPAGSQGLTAEQTSLGRRVAFLLSLKTSEKKPSKLQMTLLGILSLLAFSALASLQPVTVWEAKWLTLKDIKFNVHEKKNLFTDEVEPSVLRAVRDLPVVWPVAVRLPWQTKDVVWEYPYRPFSSEALVKGPWDFPVVAAGDGVVAQVDPLGTWLRIRHSFGLESHYKEFHVTPGFKVGDSVTLGQKIGNLDEQLVCYSLFWKGSPLLRDSWPNFAGNKIFYRFPQKP